MGVPISMPLDGEPLTEEEIEMARESSKALDGFATDEARLRLIVTESNGEERCAVLPSRAAKMLSRLLKEMAEGRPVTLIPNHAELTTHQAADVLMVSRPHLIKLLGEGKIPYRCVGTHRRIRYVDLLAFIKQEKEARRLALIELAEESQRLGLYD
jgi:excisionase family DNA binding protein